MIFFYDKHLWFFICDNDFFYEEYSYFLRLEIPTYDFFEKKNTQSFLNVGLIEERRSTS